MELLFKSYNDLEFVQFLVYSFLNICFKTKLLKNLHLTLLIHAGNQALRPSELISGHNIHRVGECHLLCIEKENCHGYNYRVTPSSVYSVNCQLSNSTKKWNKTTTEYGSWVYYEDVEVIRFLYDMFQFFHSKTQGRLSLITSLFLIDHRG